VALIKSWQLFMVIIIVVNSSSENIENFDLFTFLISGFNPLPSVACTYTVSYNCLQLPPVAQTWPSFIIFVALISSWQFSIIIIIVRKF
jgi:hypothetical protein